MNILRYFFIAITLTAISQMLAQETCPLPIMVAVDNSDETLSPANVKYLDSKLQQLVSYRGFGSKAELSHLCLVASVSETGDKQVISGNRPLVTGSFDVTIVLTNVLSGERFGADNITVSGSGNNEARMIQGAMSQINPANSDLQRFIQNSCVKVFDYYRSHIPSIIAQAKALSQRGEYNDALYLLSTVPPCVEGYDTIGSVMLATYQEYLNVDCNQKLMAARAAWEASQNEEGARVAAGYIAAIDPRSACYEEARELLDKISARIDENLRRIIAREDEDRALEHELIRGEADLKRKQVENDFLLRQQEIEALRQLYQVYAESVLKPLLEQNAARWNSNPVRHNEGKGTPVIIVNN